MLVVCAKKASVASLAPISSEHFQREKLRLSLMM